VARRAGRVGPVEWVTDSDTGGAAVPDTENDSDRTSVRGRL